MEQVGDRVISTDHKIEAGLYHIEQQKRNKGEGERNQPAAKEEIIQTQTAEEKIQRIAQRSAADNGIQFLFRDRCVRMRHLKVFMDEAPFRQIDLLPQGQTQGSGGCRIRSLSVVENRHGVHKVVVDVLDRTDNAYDLTVCIITCQSTNTKQSKLAPAVQLIPGVVEGASRGQAIVGSADNGVLM